MYIYIVKVYESFDILRVNNKKWRIDIFMKLEILKF